MITATSKSFFKNANNGGIGASASGANDYTDDDDEDEIQAYGFPTGLKRRNRVQRSDMNPESRGENPFHFIKFTPESPRFIHSKIFTLKINFSCFHLILFMYLGENDSLLGRVSGFTVTRNSDDLSDTKQRTNDFGIDESRESDNLMKALNTNKTNWTKSSPSIVHHTEV